MCDPAGKLQRFGDTKSVSSGLLRCDESEKRTYVLSWVLNELCQGRPELRRRAVCPGLLDSIQHRALWLGDLFLEPDLERAVAQMVFWRDLFLTLEPREQPLKALKAVILTTQDDVSRKYIQEVKEASKPQFVTHEMMVGTFNPADSEVSGRQGKQWRACSPVPILAIRYMQKKDDRFLTRNEQYRTAYNQFLRVRVEPE